MKIKEIRIENLRNLVDVSLEPHKKLNLIEGINGAGKTAIIESMVVLSRGRSFRTQQASELIGPERKTFRIFARVETDEREIHRLGLERSGKYWKARKDAKELKRISELTSSLPLILLEPNSHQLVSGAPDWRRKFLDWGMFHVERDFLDTHRRFSRALKQRNSALRQKKSLETIDSLDSILIPLGKRLDQLRAGHCKAINLELKTLLSRLSPGLESIEVEYENGWGEIPYEKALNQSKERDFELGSTRLGPHRADMVMKRGRVLARTVLSRGEQKIVSAAMLLAQARLLEALGEKPLILIDDLASEFDLAHFRSVLKNALLHGGQVWVTGTQIPEISEDKKTFHVKHGTVKEMI